jgi:glutamine synthetase
MLLYLDTSTAVVDPVCDVPTLSIICDVFDPLTKKAYTRDPRLLPRKRRSTSNLPV